MKFERKLLDFDLEPVQGRWVYEFDLTVKDRIVPATVILFHSHNIIQQIEGKRFTELVFRDYYPNPDVLEVAKTRLDEAGAIFALGEELFSWTRNENDKSKRRPSISL